jgi:hypothetical protein
MIKDLLEEINQKLENKDISLENAIDLCEKEKDYLTGLTICFYYSFAPNFEGPLEKKNVLLEKEKFIKKEAFFRKKVKESFGDKCEKFFKREKERFRKIEKKDISDYLIFFEKIGDRLKFTELFDLSKKIFEVLLRAHKSLSGEELYFKKNDEIIKKINCTRILNEYSQNDFEKLFSLRKKFTEKKIFNDEYMGIFLDNLVDEKKFSNLIDSYRITPETIFSFSFVLDDFDEAKRIFPYIDKKKDLLILKNHAKKKNFCIFEQEFVSWFVNKINHIYSNYSKDFAVSLAEYIIEKNESYGLWKKSEEDLKNLFEFSELKKLVLKYYKKDG